MTLLQGCTMINDSAEFRYFCVMTIPGVSCNCSTTTQLKHTAWTPVTTSVSTWLLATVEPGVCFMCWIPWIHIFLSKLMFINGFFTFTLHTQFQGQNLGHLYTAWWHQYYPFLWKNLVVLGSVVPPIKTPWCRSEVTFINHALLRRSSKQSPSSWYGLAKFHKILCYFYYLLIASCANGPKIDPIPRHWSYLWHSAPGSFSPSLRFWALSAKVVRPGSRICKAPPSTKSHH